MLHAAGAISSEVTAEAPATSEATSAAGTGMVRPPTETTSGLQAPSTVSMQAFTGATAAGGADSSTASAASDLGTSPPGAAARAGGGARLVSGVGGGSSGAVVLLQQQAQLQDGPAGAATDAAQPGAVRHSCMLCRPLLATCSMCAV